MSQIIDFHFFYVAVKRLLISKNLVVKIENLVMNYESRPFKSNPALLNQSLSTDKKMVTINMTH